MSKLPIPADERVPGMALPIKITCKECRYFKGESIFKKPCSQLGETDTNMACPKFSLNSHTMSIRGNDIESLTDALNVVSSLPTKLLKYVTIFSANESRTRDHGFHAGQRVWVQICGDLNKPYVSNFARGMVESADKTYVRVIGKNGSQWSLMHKSVLTEDGWKRKKKKLTKLGRIKDPKNHYKFIPEEEVKIGKSVRPDPSLVKRVKGSKFKLDDNIKLRDSTKVEIDYSEEE